jgi:hypothetical protein
VRRAHGVKIFQFLKIFQGVFFLRCGVLVCKGVLLSGIGRGDFFLEEFFFCFFEGIISWVGWSGWEKGGVFLLSFFFLFSLYGGLTRIFSQENIIKKSISFFEGTKHGKISPQKN